MYYWSWDLHNHTIIEPATLRNSDERDKEAESTLWEACMYSFTDYKNPDEISHNEPWLL